MAQNDTAQTTMFGIEEEAEKSSPANAFESAAQSIKGNYGLKFDEKLKPKLGTIWQIGRHRLMCGDSSTNDVEKLLDGKTIQLIHTDPPYNVNMNPEGDWGGDTEARGRKKADGKAAKSRKLVGDHISDMEFGKLLCWWFRNAGTALDPGRNFYIWGGFSNLENYPYAIRCGWLHWNQLIIWVKNMKVLTRLDFMGQSEICFYGWKSRKGYEHRKPPSGTSEVWCVENVPRQHMVHMTEKPVEIPRMAIEYSSDEGENVLDLFGGSGSTLIAAEETNRNAYLMEYDERYAEVILARCNELGMDIKEIR